MTEPFRRRHASDRVEDLEPTHPSVLQDLSRLVGEEQNERRKKARPWREQTVLPPAVESER